MSSPIVVRGGGTGLQRAVAACLQARGHVVHALAADAASAHVLRHAGLRPLIVDPHAPSRLRAELARVGARVLVDLSLAECPAALAGSAAGFARCAAAARSAVASTCAEQLPIVLATSAALYEPGDEPAPEAASFWRTGPRAVRRVVEAVVAVEHAALAAADASVLRVGVTLGRDGCIAPGSTIAGVLRATGEGSLRGGRVPLVHVDDVASAVALAVEQQPRGAWNVAAAAAPAPELAHALAAGLPRRVTPPLRGAALRAWLRRARPADATRYRAATGWTPAHAHWRELADEAVHDVVFARHDVPLV